MAFEFIKTENQEGVLVITMHDPPTRNALGPGHGQGDCGHTGPV